MDFDSIQELGFNMPYRATDIEAVVRAINHPGYFVYYPQEDVVWAPETATIYVQSCTCKKSTEAILKYVVDNDKQSIRAVLSSIAIGNTVAECCFQSNMSKSFFSLKLETIKKDANGRGLVAIGTVLPKNKDSEIDFDFERSNSLLASELIHCMGSLFYTIYYVWVREGTYFRYDTMYNTDRKNKSGLCKEEFDACVALYVAPEDRDAARIFCDISTLKDRLLHQSSISSVHKRNTEHESYGRATFIVSKRDKNGDVVNALFIVSNCDSEIIAEQKFKIAEESAMHDALTGLKNRASFEEDVLNSRLTNGALVLADVDHFKNINDVLGHSAGDDALKRVAQELKFIFGKGHVYRYGGDEFLIYVPYYSYQKWNTFCEQVHELHIRLNQATSVVGNLTLSFGLCPLIENANDKHVSIENTIKNADVALYETKRIGRKGCSCFKVEDSSIQSWSDNTQGIDLYSLMKFHQIGSWTLAITEQGVRYLVYDSLMSEKLGFPQGLSQENAWNFFYAHLYGKSVLAIEHLISKMKLGQLSEVLLEWIHPQKGKVSIRCGGVLDNTVSSDSKTLIFRGCTTILDGVHIISGYDDPTGIRTALGEQYYCNYYLNVLENSFFTYKEQDGIKVSRGVDTLSDLVNNFIEFLVEPQSQHKMKCFLDPSMIVTNLLTADSVEQEFLCSNCNYGWSLARLIVVERDLNGAPLSCCLVAESIAERYAKRIEEELAQKRHAVVLEKMVQMLSKGTLVAMGYVNADGKLNFRECRLSNYKLGTYDYQDIIAQESLYVDPVEREEFLRSFALENIQKHIIEHDKFDYTTTIRRGQAGFRIQHHNACFLDAKNKQIMFVIEDVTDSKSIDPVSGVLNREGLLLKSEEILARVRAGEKLSLVDFNINNFRAINTAYGYESGDLVLRTAADYLKQSLLQPILICRNKDDRFFCIVKTANTTPEILNKCRNFQVELSDGVHDIGFLCGVSHINRNMMSLAESGDHAMVAVQKVKRENIRSGICVFDEQMERNFLDRVYVLENLDAAINEQQFVIMYQPIYDSYSQHPVSAEALVRWLNPQRGMVPPGVFVPALEQAGLMHRVDHYVQLHVLNFLLKRIKEQKRVVPIAVNISRADLFNEDFITKTLELLDTEGFDKCLLRFEVTESCLTDLPPLGVKFLEELKKKGCHILIDDFGIGVSALRTVAEGDYDVIKLDKSFIDRIGDSTRVETVISSTINLGHRLGISVTAEGVETELQYRYLREIGCNYIQGYLFSKPLTEEAFVSVLDSMNDEKSERGPIILEATPLKD